ncbi:MAG: ribonuclease P protein component [Treponema sp.]|nr:ribonuclease P protein component [Treponema sp.]
MLISGSDFRFKRNEHLKGRKEIQEVFGKGKRYSCQGARLFVIKNNLPYNRICFTFSKASKEDRKAWNAVARNRARRLGREAYRLTKNRLWSGHDLILLIFPEPLFSKTRLQDRQKQLESLFLKAGLIK